MPTARFRTGPKDDNEPKGILTNVSSVFFGCPGMSVIEASRLWPLAVMTRSLLRPNRIRSLALLHNSPSLERSSSVSASGAVPQLSFTGKGDLSGGDDEHADEITSVVDTKKNKKDSNKNIESLLFELFPFFCFLFRPALTYNDKNEFCIGVNGRQKNESLVPAAANKMNLTFPASICWLPLQGIRAKSGGGKKNKKTSFCIRVNGRQNKESEIPFSLKHLRESFL